MTISFSGLASGLDTSSWIESLVALKRAKVTTLQEQKQDLLVSKDTLNSIKSFFNSFRSTIERITDTKFNVVSMDLFAQNIATSANLNVLTATATTEAEEGTYKVKVDKLASKTNATSNFKYTTTIVETTTATADSKLKDIGVKAGKIGVYNNGIEHTINITEKDTIATFIEKLQTAGVEASFNESTGIFYLKEDTSSINDIDNTGIIEKLHLTPTNDAYVTYILSYDKVETETKPADETTLLSDLNVNTGTFVIKANDTEYDITIDSDDTLGDLITALKGNFIDATLENGIFTLNDAEIINEGSTNIMTAMGLSSSVYSKSQTSGTLTQQTTTTEITTATSATLLKEIGEGTAITDDSTVIVRNSNNEYTTITVGTASTIGDLMSEMSNAGLYAAINNDGTVEISGGTITGGTFDAISALGLETEPLSAMTTGNPLTETVVEHKVVDLQTRLVNDLGVTKGYLEVTDADGNIYYEKIYSGQTIADFMADMGNLGIYTSLDENTGVLSITGGAFRTLEDDEVQDLVTANVIAETDANYIKGTNLLECLYGSGTISTDQISVTSTYARTRALTQTTTNTVNATLDTTLGALGLTGEGIHAFNTGDRTFSINITADMTIAELMTALEAEGVGTSWDAENSKLTIYNAATAVGMTNIDDVFNFTQIESGKYTTSNALYATNEYAVDANRDSLLSEYGISTTETVYLHTEDGNTQTLTVDGTTNLGTLIDTLNTMGVTATLANGIIDIDGGYLENSNLETALGLRKSVAGSSHILGNQIYHTVTSAVTGTSTLGEIISAMGTEDAVSGGYTLAFNGTDLTVDENTTLNNLIEQIFTAGGTATLDTTGRIRIEGGTLTGSVAEALGFTSATVTTAVSASSGTISSSTTVNADETTTLAELGVNLTTTSQGRISIRNASNAYIGTFTVENTTTLGSLFDSLEAYEIYGSIEDGVITLESPTGSFALGTAITKLGLTRANGEYTTITVTTGTTATSSEKVTYTTTQIATETTELRDIAYVGGFVNSIDQMTKEEAEANGCVWVTTREELTLALTHTSKPIVLGADIDLSGENWEPIDSFMGTLDGNGYVIKNMTIEGANDFGFGFFGHSFGGTVKNLGFENATIDLATEIVSTDVGIIVGTNFSNSEGGDTRYYGKIDNCYVADSVINGGGIKYVGGLVGYHSGAITNSASDVTINITSSMSAGTLVGYDMGSASVNLYYDNTQGLSHGVDTGHQPTPKAINFDTINKLQIMDSSDNLVTEIEISGDESISDLFTKLEPYGITGSITNGIISLKSVNGNYVTGYLADNMGLTYTGETTELVSVNPQQTSSVAITYTTTTVADSTSTLKEMGVWTEHITQAEAEAMGYTWVTTKEELANALTNSTSDTKVMLGAEIGLDFTWKPIENFKGTLDGNGYEVYDTGYDYDDAIESYGFFSNIDGGTVKNLTIGYSEYYFHGENYCKEVGALAGKIDNATIDNVRIYNSYTELYDSESAMGDDRAIGFLAGRINNSTVTNCKIENGNIEVESLWQGNDIGGIAGCIRNSNINNCAVIDGVIVTDFSPEFVYAGGFAGLTNNVTIKDSQTSTTLDKAYQLGYLVGEASNTTLLNIIYEDVNPDMDALGDQSRNNSVVAKAGTITETSPLMVCDSNGTTIANISVDSTTTVNDIFNELASYGITGTIENGVISLNSTNGNYIKGTVATQLGIETVNTITTITTGTSATSAAPITFTEERVAQVTDKVGDWTHKQVEFDGTITASGVTGNTIAISTVEDLVNLSNLVAAGNDMSGKTFVQTNNISLADIANWNPIGSEETAFSGTYDGNYYTISDLTQTSGVMVSTVLTQGTVDNVMGLFGVAKHATIKDLKIENSNITSTAASGASVACAIGNLCGYSNESNISNIEIINGYITVSNTGTSGYNYIGGAIGSALSLDSSYNITEIQTSGVVTGSSLDGYYGGIFGQVETTQTLSKFHSETSTGGVGSSCFSGGIVGKLKNTNSNTGHTVAIACTNAGAVSTSMFTGGLFGKFEDSSSGQVLIIDCYNSYTGSLNSETIGDTTKEYITFKDCGAISSLKADGISESMQSYTNPHIGINNIRTYFSGKTGSGTAWETNDNGNPRYANLHDTIEILGNTTGTIANVSDMTFEELFAELNNYGIVCTMNNGVITLDSTSGNLISGEIAEKLGIELNSTTTTVTTTSPLTLTSTAAVTYTETAFVAATETLGATKYVINGSISATEVTGTTIGISTVEDLQNLATLVNAGNTMSGKTFVLMNDIDLSSVANWTSIGTTDEAHSFKGTFDGMGHTISNLTQEVTIEAGESTNKRGGLFGYASEATLKNIKIKDATMTAINNDGTNSAIRFGGVVGEGWLLNISGIEVENITINGDINCEVGGVVGYASGIDTIKNCSTSGTITWTSSNMTGLAGGIAGRIAAHPSGATTIDNCQNNINITGGGAAGGIVGHISAASKINISNVLNKGSITSNSGIVSGIVGQITATETRSFTINIDHSVNLGTLSATNTLVNAADIAILRAVSSNAESYISSSALNITNCYGLSNTNSNGLYDTFSSSATQWADLQIDTTGSLTNQVMGTIRTRVRASAYGFDTSKWAPSSTGATDINLKTGDEYDIFICDQYGSIKQAYDLNASNTIQDVTSALMDWGTTSYSNGVISFTPTASTISACGTGTSILNSATPLTKTNTVTMTDSTTLAQLGCTSTAMTITTSAGTITVSATNTVGDLMLALSELGFSSQIIEGKLEIKSDNGAYIKSIGNSTLRTKLKLGTIGNNYSYTRQTSTTTAYANSTTSDKLIRDEEQKIASSTKLSQIGLDSNGYITVVSNGTESVYTLTSEQTIGDLLTLLAANNISGSIVDGKLTIENNESSYIKDLDSRVLNGLGYNSINEFYRADLSVITTNSNSNTISEKNTESIKTSSTFKELGITENCYMTVTSNGTLYTITVEQTDTVGELLTTLAGYGIAGSIEDGKLTLQGSQNSYLVDLSEQLSNALKIEGSELVYGNIKEYQTNSLNDKVLATLNYDTTAANIGIGGARITIVQNGTESSITIGASETMGEILNRLGNYGIDGSITGGKLTLTPTNENTYLKYAFPNCNMPTGYTTTTEISGSVSSSQFQLEKTVLATGTTELQALIDSSGNAPSNYELVISTNSGAGNNLVTVTMEATSTIDDVVKELENHGIEASIDKNGIMKLKSYTLTDFEISGGVGDLLMETCVKHFDETKIINTSSVLNATTEDIVDDSTLLSKIGVTDGTVEVLMDAGTYTLTIDSTKSLGDFRLQLAELGITSSIIGGKLSLNANGSLSFATPAGGSNIVDIIGLNNSSSINDYSQTSTWLGANGANEGSAKMDTLLSELKDSDGNNLGITSGQIYAYQNGTRYTININTNESLQDLATKLSQYGIDMEISSEGKLYFYGDGNSYLTTDGLSSDVASNILTKLGVDSTWNTKFDSVSQILSYEEEVDTKVNGSTKLTDLQDEDGNSLGITEGTYYVYQNGVRKTETITSDTTVNDFVSTLSSYGMTTNFDENGALNVGAYNNTYLATSVTSGDDTNLVDVLFEQWNFVNVYTSNGLDVPTDVTVAISETTMLKDINVADPSDKYNAGNITVIKDGVQTNIELTENDTVGDLMDELALYGFESVINSNGQLIIKNTGNSLLQADPSNGVDSNALDLLGIGLSNWVNTNTYESNPISKITYHTENVSATRDTLLSEFGVTTGEYYIYNNGVKYTALVSSDETLGSLMDTLESFGLETSLVDNGSDSVISIAGNGESYIAKSNSTTNASNVVEKLFTDPTSSYSYTGLQQTSSFVTNSVLPTEETLLSVFDKDGNKAEGILSINVDGDDYNIEINRNETFGSLINKIESIGLEATLLPSGNLVIQAGFKDCTINTDNTTSDIYTTLKFMRNLNLGGYSASSINIEQTTSTVEEKTLSASNYADNDTKMGLLNISSGTLTVYRDGEKATIQIDSENTFGDLRSLISARFSDVDIKFEDGYLTFFSTTDNIKVEVGSTTDTSNFSAITGISNDENGQVKSSRELYCVNSSSLIVDSGLFRNGDVKEGTFVIGDETFTIDDKTTLSDIISQINASQKANATAYWDSIDGKLVLQSRTTGAALVNIEAGTSNFTDIMGFTKSEWADADSDGVPDIGQSQASVTKMNINAQEVGENAKFAINGTYYTSTSNVIGSDVSRIKGLTINLKGVSEGETTITVERDKETVANAVSDVVDAYNELIENVDKEIAKGSPLDDQFTLKLIRNQIRSLMTSSLAGINSFKNLDSIGISLEKASANNISTENIDKLSFDKDKFIKAFDSDRDALKNLLVGTDSNKGIFQQVESVVESAVSGYFMSAEKSYGTQISRLNTKIERAEKTVARYQERLEAKFASMDLLISQMQNQYSSFLAG